MFARLNSFARPTFTALALSLAAVSASPAVMAGELKPIYEEKHHDEYECQSLNKAIRYLKKRNYKMIEKVEKEAEEGIYLFTAKKKNYDHEYVHYYITYDACDHEIVSRTPIKEEKM